MQIFGASHIFGSQPIGSIGGTQQASGPSEANGLLGSDQIDISPEADMISRVQETNDVRADRIAQIRAQIADGTYETHERLDIAVGRLLDQVIGR
jgi:negative regulator of flagellin synthesis FlgM